MSRLTRDGTAKSISRYQFLRRERGQGNIHSLCSADHEQDWQPYLVDPYSRYMCDPIYTESAVRYTCFLRQLLFRDGELTEGDRCGLEDCYDNIILSFTR